ncbi:hypothetical protein C4D60_Mb03t04860 [Musa balbisiana]|uniref:Uncharacterized protein n=1 Tax=Musa balbisiana TaxID=52838 RepID=A0A4S8J7Y1_MUSBA|nr:hypothetical protein C4D60_Mb03t04860 [Musa balbisiana]
MGVKIPIHAIKLTSEIKNEEKWEKSRELLKIETIDLQENGSYTIGAGKGIGVRGSLRFNLILLHPATGSDLA